MSSLSTIGVPVSKAIIVQIPFLRIGVVFPNQLSTFAFHNGFVLFHLFGQSIPIRQLHISGIYLMDEFSNVPPGIIIRHRNNSLSTRYNIRSHGQWLTGRSNRTSPFQNLRYHTRTIKIHQICPCKANPHPIHYLHRGGRYISPYRSAHFFATTPCPKLYGIWKKFRKMGRPRGPGGKTYLPPFLSRLSDDK
jgi:hypothetical protein